jgi:hypothetical protein
MKKLFLLPIIVAFAFTISSCSKGVSKASGGDMEAMKAELKTLRTNASVSAKEVNAVTKQMTELKEQVAMKDAQIEAMNKKYGEMTKTVKGDGMDVTRFGDDYTKGIVFKVQVGAFTNKKFKDKIDGNFWEEDADGVKKYTIGYFRDYLQAKNFKEYMREIGVSDAWIVTYEDNVRKDINNVIKK